MSAAAPTMRELYRELDLDDMLDALELDANERRPALRGVGEEFAILVELRRRRRAAAREAGAR